MHYFLSGTTLYPVEAISNYNYLKNNSAYTVAQSCLHVLYTQEATPEFHWIQSATPHRELAMM